MIAEVLEIIKKNLYLILLLILISLLSFQLGRISKTASQPIKIEKASILEIQNSKVKNQNLGNGRDAGEMEDEFKLDFRVVVSKNSNKYHFLWCSGAKRIKEENKIFFNSESEAISAGYTLAGNCSK